MKWHDTLRHYINKKKVLFQSGGQNTNFRFRKIVNMTKFDLNKGKQTKNKQSKTNKQTKNFPY